MGARVVTSSFIGVLGSCQDAEAEQSNERGGFASAGLGAPMLETLRRDAVLSQRDRKTEPRRDIRQVILNADGTAGIQVGKSEAGLYALVDQDSLSLVGDRRWYALTKPRTTYAIGGPPSLLMHRLIIGAGPDQFVDHINSNGLDNRRANLRLTDRSGNARNRRKKIGGKSPYKGVFPKGNAWVAHIRVKGVRSYLGIFDTPEAAHDAYVKAAALHFGEFARAG